MNALEASNASNYRVWGMPAVLPKGIPGNALRVFPGSFRNFSGISSGKVPAVLGVWPVLSCCGLLFFGGVLPMFSFCVLAFRSRTCLYKFS